MGSFFFLRSSSYLRARDQPKKDAGAARRRINGDNTFITTQSELLKAAT